MDPTEELSGGFFQGKDLYGGAARVRFRVISCDLCTSWIESWATLGAIHELHEQDEKKSLFTLHFSLFTAFR